VLSDRFFMSVGRDCDMKLTFMRRWIVFMVLRGFVGGVLGGCMDCSGMDMRVL